MACLSAYDVLRLVLKRSGCASLLSCTLCRRLRCAPDRSTKNKKTFFSRSHYPERKIKHIYIYILGQFFHGQKVGRLTLVVCFSKMPDKPLYR